MGTAGFEEVEGAVDVGDDEVASTGDAPINMCFRGEMHAVGDGMLATTRQTSYCLRRPTCSKR